MQKYKEKDQKLIGEAVIEEILNKNNFKDFKTKLHNKNSKCCYRTNKTTTIKLNKKETKEESAESIIVAAHEARLITLPVCGFLSFYNWQYFWLVAIFLIVFFFITKFHFKYYIYDETKTEERALEEIRSVWEKLQTDIRFEEIEKRNKNRLENNILAQVPGQKASLIMFLALSILFYLDFDKFGKSLWFVFISLFNI